MARLLRRKIAPRNDENALWHGSEHLPPRNDTEFGKFSSRFHFTFSLPNSLAFTIAEMLITLGIIGVVAAYVIPTVMTDIMQHAFTQSKDLAIKKITEATNQMKTNDVLSGYATTEAFADEFQKYMKITKRCTTATLDQCFAPTIKDGKQIININTLTTGAKLGQSTFTNNTIGLQIVNGTNIILSYKPNCERIETWDNTTSTTGCLAMLYDINGFGKPNKLGQDIGGVNVKFCTQMDDICVAIGDTTITPYGTFVYTDGKTYDNWWAGAVKVCEDQGMRLPAGKDANSELDKMYQHRDELGMPSAG
ncbi:MAG: hypothetical protein WCY19_08520, partial [Candidatus Gastranaerophilaceae bacterium]